MTDLAKGLEAFSRAAREAGINIGQLAQATQPPPSDGYKPMHIPDWWHEEYLKSLEPKPPFNLDTFLLSRFDDIAVGFADFAESVFRGLGRFITRKDYQ